MKRNFLYGIGIALSAITPHITALEQVLPDLLFIDNQTNEPVIIQVTQGNKLILRDGILAPAKNVSRVSAYQHTTSPSPRAGAIPRPSRQCPPRAPLPRRSA